MAQNLQVLQVYDNKSSSTGSFGKKAYLNGFSYNIKNKKRLSDNVTERLYWECDFSYCSARLTSTSTYVVLKEPTHSHNSDPSFHQAHRAVSELKLAAKVRIILKNFSKPYNFLSTNTKNGHFYNLGTKFDFYPKFFRHIFLQI